MTTPVRKVLSHGLLSRPVLSPEADSAGGDAFERAATGMERTLDRLGQEKAAIAADRRLSNQGQADAKREAATKALGGILDAVAPILRKLAQGVERTRAETGSARRFTVADIAVGTTLALAQDGEFIERPDLPSFASFEGALLLEKLRVAQQHLLGLQAEPRLLNVAIVNAYNRADMVVVVGLDQLPGTLTDELARKAAIKISDLRAALHEKLRPGPAAQLATLTELLTQHRYNLGTAERAVHRVFGVAPDTDTQRRFQRLMEATIAALSGATGTRAHKTESTA